MIRAPPPQGRRRGVHEIPAPLGRLPAGSRHVVAGIVVARLATDPIGQAVRVPPDGIVVNNIVVGLLELDTAVLGSNAPVPNDVVAYDLIVIRVDGSKQVRCRDRGLTAVSARRPPAPFVGAAER